MKKEIKEMRSKLNEENLELFNNIYSRINSQIYEKSKMNQIQIDVLGMLVEAQTRGVKAEDVFGTDIEIFCKDVLENNKEAGGLIAFKIFLIIVACSSLIFLIEALINLSFNDGIDNIFYNYQDETYLITHNILEKLSILIEKNRFLYSFVKVSIISLIINLVGLNTFKLKKPRVVAALGVGLVSFFMIWIEDSDFNVFKNANYLDGFIEVKLSLIGIVFIISTLIYILLDKRIYARIKGFK